jgi:hypothetical protein
MQNTEDEQYLFGDYKYGEDALDKDLWGDDDLIYGGNASAGTEKAWRYGGDGADSIHTGEGWAENISLGGNGDDKFYIDQKNAVLKTYGEDGDDEWDVKPYSYIVEEDNETGAEYAFGGAGNDVVRGTHQATGKQWLYGGDDEDKIYGGDKVAGTNRLSGGVGDDWIEGGDLAVGPQHIYGDSFYLEPLGGFSNVTYGKGDELSRHYKVDDKGDDVIYGGNSFANSQYLVGGYGDDKIIGGDKGANYQYAHGDVNKYTSGMYPADHPNAMILNDGNDRVHLGLPSDGDDLIDMGDHPDHVTYGIYAYGQGGNDKIIGGISSVQ